MRVVEVINFVIMCLFFLCYSYQFVYIPVSLFGKKKPYMPAKLHRYAVLIAARNEQSVIGELISSIKAQDYPVELVDIYVVADNCTDCTAKIAAEYGASVFERFDTSQVGKGHALKYLLEQISHERGSVYAAYFVFDADNILSPNYISEMNKTFSNGYNIVTSYRNSKNYADNWISAGYALWFLREARYLNNARMILGTSCAVSGTGFMFSQEAIERSGGWNYFLLTEDIEFTIDNVLQGEKIGYCHEAVIYDEQPTSFRQSWRQRMRWSRGYMQVFGRYGKPLMKGIIKDRSMSCFDMAMNIMPAAILSVLSLVVNISAAFVNFNIGGDMQVLLESVLQTLTNLSLTLFAIGGITTISEWKKIHCSSAKKILYALTFPLFMFTYLPICLVSMFVDVKWQPIRHSRSMSLSQIYAGSDAKPQLSLGSSDKKTA